MAQIFISHAEEDQAITTEIGTALERSGFSVWYHERDGAPGIHYLEQVSTAIEECEVFVLIISTASIGSRNVTTEFIHAHENEKDFLPILSGLTYVEAKAKAAPRLRIVLSNYTSIHVPTEGVSSILDKVEEGVKAFGVKPDQPVALPEQRLMPHKRAYICYAREDRLEVLKRTQGLAAAGLEILDRHMRFEPGEDWTEQMLRMIGAADIFYLFWSRAASRSEWVMREIRCVLELHEKRGSDSLPVIQPVPLEDPAMAPPPPELLSLHFNDPLSYHINAEEYQRQKRSPRKK